MHRTTLKLYGEFMPVRHLDAHQQVSLQKLQPCCRNAFIHFLDVLTQLCEADLINDWLRTAKDNSILELVWFVTVGSIGDRYSAYDGQKVVLVEGQRQLSLS